ncbi:TonB-dependent receptor plug domain-containing protein [Psychromonas aquatilis]|uniref:TonB-dependent receptor plug domain-containing protein n=1 Tax=Psychromonas aquatilis TaxID=2005072 RepID=A0ABU9GNJ5_9GAMM
MKIINNLLILSLAIPALSQAEDTLNVSEIKNNNNEINQNSSKNSISSEESIKLEDISIVGEIEQENETLQATTSYESYDPLDSGLSVISENSINESQQGDMDTTELLKVLPFVQTDIERYDGSAQSEQHIRPSDFSISGGSYYDNNIMIDGVSVNSVMDVTQSTDNENYDEVNGQTSQTLYVAPSLLQAVEVQDSNISAQYGGFSGGTVDYQVREAGDEFKAQISTGFQFDEMVSYLGEDPDGDPKPDFIKYRTSMSFDLPISDKFKLLVAYSRAESQSYYQMDEQYGNEDYTNGDLSQNFLLKGTYQFNDNLSATGMMMYSPYESEYTADDDYDSERLTLSTGFATYLQLDGYHNQFDWSARLSYNQSDNSRDWDGDRYKWDTGSAYGSTLCDSTYCYEGGFGDIEQTQEDYTLKLSASRNINDGVLSFGSESSYTRAYKQRPEDSWYYYQYAIDQNNGIVCSSGDDACMSDIAFTDAVRYESYEADVGVYQQALWAEYQQYFGPVDLRLGVRYEYDNFMHNHNIAPRLNVSWEVFSDYFVSFGANRYYTNNMLAYAIRSATPATTTYHRDLNGDSTLSEWDLASVNTNYDYSQGNLNTPYSDEITLAFTVPTALDGTFRIKGIKRWGRDKFSTSREYDQNSDLGYTLANDGKTDYHGISLEWNGRIGDHVFTANTTWSETITFGGPDYFSETDIDDMESTYLYYNGEVISEYQLSNIRKQQNYAAPFRAHLSWGTSWFNKRLLTKTSLNYRGEYTNIDSDGTAIEVDGQNYDVYDETTIDAFADISLNAMMEVYKTVDTSTVVDMRVTNLLNQNPYSAASSYQRGRSFWLGISVNLK